MFAHMEGVHLRMRDGVFCEQRSWERERLDGNEAAGVSATGQQAELSTPQGGRTLLGTALCADVLRGMNKGWGGRGW